MATKPQPFQPTTEIVIDSLALPAAPEIKLHFDYSVFDPATAEAMQKHARRIKTKGHKIGAELIDIGGELTAAKERVEHGHWLDWLQVEHQLDDRAAQRLMAIHREFRDQRQIASLFNPTVLGIMAGRKIPAAAKQELIQQAQTTGQSPTEAQARSVINQHKAPNTTVLSHLGTAKTQPTTMTTAQSTTTTTPTIILPPPATELTAWQIQNHVLTWLADYNRTDRRPFDSILTDLHNQKAPAWAHFSQYVQTHQLQFSTQTLTMSLNGASVTMRTTQNPTQATAPRFLSLAETTALIWSVIRTAAPENTPASLYEALRTRRRQSEYSDILATGLVISNQIFQTAWQQIEHQLTQNTPADTPASAPLISVTLQLSAEQLATLKLCLQNATKLPPDLTVHLYQQIQEA